MKLTIVITKGEEYYIGSIKEIPPVVSQGPNIEETKANVIDALQLYLEDMQSASPVENIVLEEDLIFGNVS